MSKRTKEELGNLAYGEAMSGYGDYTTLSEYGKRMWDRVGRTVYNEGVRDALNMIGEHGYDVNEDRLCRDVLELKVE